MAITPTTPTTPTKTPTKRTDSYKGKNSVHFIVLLVVVLAIQTIYFNFEVSNFSTPTSKALCDNTVPSYGNNNNNRTIPKNSSSSSISNSGRLFVCGFNVTGLALALFPDYGKRSFSRLTNASQPNTDDVLVHAMHGPCDAEEMVVVDVNIHGLCEAETLEFPGKILYVEGEPFFQDWTRANKPGTHDRIPHHAIEDVYQIGMLPDTKHSVAAYFGPILFTYHFQGKFPYLASLDKKPKNSGTHRAVIYIYRRCLPYREKAARRLSSILPIHYGGKCEGSPGTNATPTPETVQRTEEEPGFFAVLPGVYNKYKFCMSMDNANHTGYLSEKIIMAFLGGCIPIYYGGRHVFDVFNSKAFVFYDIHNPRPALAQIRYLLKNETAYMDMLHNQPILAHGDDTARDYFSFSDDIGDGYLKHKIRVMMGIDNDG